MYKKSNRNYILAVKEGYIVEKRFRKFKEHEIGTIKDYRELVNRAVEKYGDKVAFKNKIDVNGDKKYVEHSFKQYGQDVKFLATSLLNSGFRNKRIALIGKNRYEWCVSYMAVTTGGMVIIPLDKSLPEMEIKSLIKRSKADCIIFDKKYLDIIKKMRQENDNNLIMYICMDEINESEILFFGDLIADGKKLIEEGDMNYDGIKVDSEGMTIMLFTSGTTSISKAVMLSQKNICSNINAMPHFVLMYESDTLLSFLPIHHTFECTISFLYGCLYCGATIAFCNGLKYIVENLKEYNVTVFVAVPLMLEKMYKKILTSIDKMGKKNLINTMTHITNALNYIHIDIRRNVYKQILDSLGGKLRLVLYGGAPMEKSTVIGLSSFGINMVQGYGLTETSPVISAETDFYKRPGSSGLIMVNEDVKIDSPNEDGIGEIIVKGPNVMLGYYENEEETKNVLKDGWFYTGDLGKFDKDGFLYLTGRKKEVIVLKNGKNVYPQEIEFLISKLDIVDECIVYGKPTDNNDYIISAKIVYNEEEMKRLYPEKQQEDYYNTIWDIIKNVINSNMPNYKHIKEIIVTNEPLIKTTTQKVKRKEELKKIGIK